MSSDPIDRNRAMYEASGNVLYIWEALASASVDKTHLPPWIAEYLRTTAVALCRLKGTPKKRAGMVCGVLGIIRGNVNAFAEISKDDEAAWTALESGYFRGGDPAAEILARERGAKTAKQLDAEMQRVRRRVERAKAHRRSID